MNTTNLTETERQTLLTKLNIICSQIREDVIVSKNTISRELTKIACQLDLQTAVITAEDVELNNVGCSGFGEK